MEVLGVVLTITFATIEAGLFGWAVGTYWQLDAIRWYLTRLLPAAAIVHVIALVGLVIVGGAPTKDTYLVGMLLGLIVGLPAVTIGTWLLQRHFDRKFRAKPADLRALEAPPEERVHAALDPERTWERRRIDASDADVVPRRLGAKADAVGSTDLARRPPRTDGPDDAGT